MKIFNWVHRRFNNNHKENGDDELAKDAREQQSDVEINDCVARDNNNNSNNNFVGWNKGGILLTIGTFGYGPLKNDYDDDDEELVDEEQLEITIASDYYYFSDKDVDEEVKPLIDAGAAVYNYYAHEDYLMKIREEEEEEAIDVNDKEETIVAKNKNERTTLAQLFSAEEKSEEGITNGRKSTAKKIINSEEKTSKLAKESRQDKNDRVSSSSAAKKKKNKSYGKDAAADSPMMGKRLHRLVTRMLKKKIHPELGLNNNNNKHVDPVPKSACGAREIFDSLLPIPQGAVM